ncbi:MAG: TRAP transporter fused permease subunit [Peptococcaceae bacterium]|nr:TRAP transporter fused permease subunit [Peptococcaceae bacterium]
MRELSAKLQAPVKYIAAAFSLFYLYVSGVGLVSTEANVGLYLLFTNMLCLILYPLSKKTPHNKLLAVVDGILVVLGTASVIYWIAQYSEYSAKRVGMPNDLDMFFGVVMILISLEVTRRALGNVLAILGLVFVVQLYFGPHLPGYFAHKGFSVTRIIEYNYSTMEGIFGTVASVFATYVMPFLVFGAFLQRTGGGDFFIDLARALAGRISGGPALIAIWCSCAFGMISGSPIANVMSIGNFTIPMMKNAGYKPEFAGAVEAAASTGGQFMPPVMGAGAFILATLTETPYSVIMVMAILPALLYYLSLTMMIYFNAKKNGLVGLKKEELPVVSEVMRRGWYYLFTIVVAAVLIVAGFSVPMVAFWATIFVIFCSMLRKDTRLTMTKFVDTLEEAGKGSIMVGATAGTLGLVMGGITLSGLGVKFSAAILSLSFGSIFLSIILIGLIATVIGMGLPTTASYIVLAILAAPSLIQMGLPPVLAHLLCFWLSMTSNVTPPVCVAAFAAASVAKSDPMKTGLHACVLALFLYLMPFAFAYAPQVTIYGYGIGKVLEIVTSYGIATVALAAAIQGWLFRNLKVLERLVFLAATIFLAIPNVILDLVGLAILVMISAWVCRRRSAIAA